MSDVRLLHRDSSRGYTTLIRDALPMEPEAIPEEDQQVISLRARSAFAEQRKEETERRDSQMWLDRQRKMEMRARSKGTDVHRYLIEIRRQVVAAERFLDEAA